MCECALTNGVQPACQEEPATGMLPSGCATTWEVILAEGALPALGQPDPAAIVSGPMDF